MDKPMSSPHLNVGDLVQFKRGLTTQLEAELYRIDGLLDQRGLIIEDHELCPVYRGPRKELYGRTGWHLRRLVTVHFPGPGELAKEVPASLFKRYKD